MNNYALRTEAWVRANPYKTRHHKQCNFDLFFVQYDPKKLVPKHKWRDADEEDDEKDDEKDDEGDENEKSGKKPTPKAPTDEKPDDDGEDDVKEQPKKPKLRPFTPPDQKVKPPKTGKPTRPAPTPTPITRPLPTPKKGELNPEFGIYVERPFYI